MIDATGVLLVTQLVTLLLGTLFFLWTARELAKHKRENAKRVAQLLSQISGLSSRVGRVLSEDAYLLAQRCVFALSLASGGEPVGIGVLCGSAGSAVTACHNLRGAVTGSLVYGKVFPSAGENSAPVPLTLKIVHLNPELDYAILHVVKPRAYPHFLTCYTGPLGGVTGGAALALCAFQQTIQEDLDEQFSSGLGVMSANGVRLSPHARHLLYSCITYAGDSGGALLMHDGELVGVHLDFVNALREGLARKASVDERLSGVEGSLAALVARAGQGTCVALLASEFERHVIGAA